MCCNGNHSHHYFIADTNKLWKFTRKITCCSMNSFSLLAFFCQQYFAWLCVSWAASQGCSTASGSFSTRVTSGLWDEVVRREYKRKASIVLCTDHLSKSFPSFQVQVCTYKDPYINFIINLIGVKISGLDHKNRFE